MPARVGMADLIVQLRGYADAGTADYQQVGGTAQFWDDTQLQLALDRHLKLVYREQLTSFPTIGAGGAITWKEYRSANRNLEQTTGGTAQFTVVDASGSVQPSTLYAVDYVNGVVTFNADTGGSAYFVTGRAFDLYAAASDVWRTKAGQAAKGYDISTDNHRLTRSQLMKQALEMSDYFATLQNALVTTLYRSDGYAGDGGQTGPVRTRDHTGEGW